MKKILLICLFFINSIYSQFSWIDPTPTGYQLLSAFKFPDGISFAGGVNGSLYKSTDDGITWKNIITGTYASINSIHFINENVGFFASDSGIFKTVDTGEHWQLKVNGFNFKRIRFSDSSTGYIVSNIGILCKTSDGGLNWSLSGIDHQMDDVYFIDSLNGIIAGGQSMFGGIINRTSDGGVTWSRCYNSSEKINGMGFATNKFGTAVGDNNLRLRTTDGGLTWTKQNTSGGSFNTRVVFFDSLNGLITGDDGWIMTTANSGLDWNSQSVITGGYIYDIYFASSGNGIAVGNSGNISRIKNGSWIPITKRIGYPPFRFFYFKDSKNGFASGEYLYKTSDGGNNWSAAYGMNWGYLSGMTFLDENKGFLVGPYIIGGGGGQLLSTNDGGQIWSQGIDLTSNGLFDINHCSSSKLTIVGYSGNILTSSDRGATWISRSSGTTKTLFSIAILDSLNQMVVGDSGVILKSYNSGESWTLKSSNVTWMLRSVKVLNNKILFAAGSGGIIKSTDNGETWTQISGAGGNLNMISFADNVNGLAAGDYGTLLKTTDGGNSWIKIPTGLISDLYSVGFVDSYNALISGSSGYNENNCLLKYSLSSPTSVFEDSRNVYSSGFYLRQNYPNPFNPSTTINFTVPVPGIVRLHVYDLLGREVAELINGELSAGNHSVQFNARNLPNGVYFYRMDYRNYSATKKLILLK